MSFSRDAILARLEQDLIGPDRADELLDSRPSDIYLTGIIWPARQHQAEDDEGGLAAGSDDGSEGGSGNEAAPPRSVTKPSSAGISFAFKGADGFNVVVKFGTYEERLEEGGKTRRWQRRDWKLDVPISAEIGHRDLPVTGAPEGICLNVRIASAGDLEICTVTLVNRVEMPADAGRVEVEQSTLFQTCLEIQPIKGTRLVARPSVKSLLDDEDRSNALLYRDVKEYATGHNCSATWRLGVGNEVDSVGTAWVPRAVVPKTSESGHEVFKSLTQRGAEGPLGSEWLGSAGRGDLVAGLRELVKAYDQWIDLQSKKIPGLSGDGLRDAARKNLERCTAASTRMQEGIDLIETDSSVLDAFQLANRAMALQRSWSKPGEPLVWRPFQLAFILLSCASLLQRNHPDRGVMDLLWFPTGGGKTEAYLGLIAMLAFHRRLRNGNPDAGDGTAAIMRYTLRLLTTQQFERASAMVLACEAIRRGSLPNSFDVARIGASPFSIGLWVGGDATPNNCEAAAKAWAGANASGATAKQIKKCPCCGSVLKWTLANTDDACVEVRCPNDACVLHFDGAPLPIFTVDTDIYRERPTLLIGTIDKFAQISRSEKPRSFLGLTGGDPPDLVLQDELHLISGPLGTIAGLYEVALDRLMTRDGIRPKIIGSTATIRRASEQVLSLFDRRTFQFPPPAIDADDSGFAVTDESHPGRLYAGITSAGRSPKFTLQAVAATLLQSAPQVPPAEVDAYWTLLGYFNSLRELGGAVVMMQDDVHDSIRLYAERHHEEPRSLEPPEELTSRRSQTEIVEMLDTLKTPAGKAGCVDVVLATNMVSVGVDVSRLALMLVNGQPKTIAEYIQSTSRVGRSATPGLVISVLNNSKARDKSHFETFPSWHQALYRDVEATSVTPFAPRARDRGLHAVLVALVRHLVPGMEAAPDKLPNANMSIIQSLIDDVVSRASRSDPDETEVRRELQELMDLWAARLPKSYLNPFQTGNSLMQDADRAAALRAAHRSSGAAWPTMNNMRSVEPSTRFRLYTSPRAAGNRGGDDGQI